MEIISEISYGNMKRCWKRKRYQRLKSSNRRKLKIVRLGSTGTTNRRFWKLRMAPKLQLKFVSPIQLLAKVHDAYIDMMIRLANNMGKLSSNGLFRGRKVARDGHISMSSSGDEVDSRLVLEIYKRLAAASRDLSDF